ncbi:MAG: hypothetical protein Q9166_005665, partial [cf. Caloplaca sp. 2 TL-2023]
NIGYLLHPFITSNLPCSPTIADIGTGTGVFLTRLAELYPTATLRGFDITSRRFPAPEALPSNVELKIMDIKTPPPPTEQNRYDVVHVRLLTAAMAKSTDWDIAVGNILPLLKPGGALQWEEGNFAQGRHLRGNEQSSVSAARYMGTIFRESLLDTFSYGWSTLPHIMRAVGFLGVDEDIVSSDRIVETRKALTQNGMRAILAWAKKMDHDTLGFPVEKLREFETQAERDIESGCYVRFDIHIVMGFRPS